MTRAAVRVADDDDLQIARVDDLRRPSDDKGPGARHRITDVTHHPLSQVENNLRPDANSCVTSLPAHRLRTSPSQDHINPATV